MAAGVLQTAGQLLLTSYKKHKQVGFKSAEALSVSGRQFDVKHKAGQHEVLATRQGSFAKSDQVRLCAVHLGAQEYRKPD